MEYFMQPSWPYIIQMSRRYIAQLRCVIQMSQRIEVWIEETLDFFFLFRNTHQTKSAPFNASIWIDFWASCLIWTKLNDKNAPTKLVFLTFLLIWLTIISKFMLSPKIMFCSFGLNCKIHGFQIKEQAILAPMHSKFSKKLATFRDKLWAAFSELRPIVCPKEPSINRRVLFELFW